MADPMSQTCRDGRSSAPRNHRRWAVMAGVYLAIFLTIMALAYTNSLPPQLGYIPYYDKIGHGVLYAIAAYLGHRAAGGCGILFPCPSLPSCLACSPWQKSWCRAYRPTARWMRLTCCGALEALPWAPPWPNGTTEVRASLVPDGLRFAYPFPRQRLPRQGAKQLGDSTSGLSALNSCLKRFCRGC